MLSSRRARTWTEMRTFYNGNQTPTTGRRWRNDQSTISINVWNSSSRVSMSSTTSCNAPTWEKRRYSLNGIHLEDNQFCSDREHVNVYWAYLVLVIDVQVFGIIDGQLVQHRERKLCASKIRFPAKKKTAPVNTKSWFTLALRRTRTIIITRHSLRFLFCYRHFCHCDSKDNTNICDIGCRPSFEIVIETISRVVTTRSAVRSHGERLNIHLYGLYL